MWHYMSGILFNLKRKEILTYPLISVNLEDIVPSEISQSQNDKCCMIPLTWIIKLIEAQRKSMVARGWGRGNEAFCLLSIVSVL